MGIIIHIFHASFFGNISILVVYTGHPTHTQALSAGLEQEVTDCGLIESQTVGSDDTQEYEALSWCWGVEKEHMKALLQIHFVQYVFSLGICI